MPSSFTSAARLAPNAETKDFVAAYSTVNGDTMAAAAEEVYTKQPRSFLAFCASRANLTSLPSSSQHLSTTSRSGASETTLAIK